MTGNRILQFVFSFSFLMVSPSVFADNFITNGGFEGANGIEAIPPDWNPGCGISSTPDSQPGWYNVYLKPKEGKSFVNLLYKADGSEESIYQELENPMPKGSCYLIDLHLAMMCQDSLHGLNAFGLNNPGTLIVRGSEVFGCETGQILAEFKVVDNCKWEQKFAIFQSTIEINYIHLEFRRGDSEAANGSILIDDIKIDFTEPLPDQIIEVPFKDSSTVFSTFDGSGFDWEIDGVSFLDDSSYQQIYVDHNFQINLTYTSEDSCTIYESFIVYVDPIIPNIVTPSSRDFVNDAFEIRGLLEQARLRVMNRWGQTVYENTDYRNDWIPELKPGTYYYILNLLDSGREKQGMVYIN